MPRRCKRGRVASKRLRTVLLKFLELHSFRMSSPNLCTRFDVQAAYSGLLHRKLRNGATWHSACTTTFT
jgi:hypothetical protein